MSASAPRRARVDPLKQLLASLNAVAEDVTPYEHHAMVRDFKKFALRFAGICEAAIAQRPVRRA